MPILKACRRWTHVVRRPSDRPQARRITTARDLAAADGARSFASLVAVYPRRGRWTRFAGGWLPSLAGAVLATLAPRGLWADPVPSVSEGASTQTPGSNLTTGTAAAALRAPAPRPVAGGNKTMVANPAAAAEEPTALDMFDADFSYVGASNFKIRRFGGATGLPLTSYGKQDEFQQSYSYGHRILLRDKVYLRLGASYERFDFAGTTAPLPTSLQSIQGLVMLEYVVQNQPAAFLRISPGVHYSDVNDITLGSVDVDVDVGVSFPISRRLKLYGLAGVHYSLLASFPVFPLVGAVWVLSDKLRIMGVPPEPQIVYSLNDKLDLHLGAELVSGAYRRDRHQFTYAAEQRFSGGVINYSETRGAAGLTYSPANQVEIDLNGGWDFQRNFDYFRGPGKRFRTHGAPYTKIALSVKF